MVRSMKSLFKIPVFLLSMCFLISCNLFVPELEPLDDDNILYASFDGSFKGWLAFDANTLEVVDSLEMDKAVGNFDISDDRSTFYTICGDLIATDINTKTIKMRTPTRNSLMIQDRSKEHIITYCRSGYLQFYDAETFELVYEDSLGEGIRETIIMVASPTEDIVYSTYFSEQKGASIMVYNMQTYQIERLIHLSDDFSRTALIDLKISPDGNYLFAVNNTDGLFYVFDLSSDEIIHTHTCNPLAQIAVSPDGNYVYLSDPASQFEYYVPKNQVLRYDVSSNKTKVFIRSPRDIGLSGSYLYTEKIIIAPDNRTMFVTLSNLRIAKIDTEIKEIVSIYRIPKDYRGYITSEIKSILLVK